MYKNKVKLGIAPIGWTNDDIPRLGIENTFEQCISEMALAGFTGSEVGNKFPKDPVILKEYLCLRGLEICNQWCSLYLASIPYSKVEQAFRKQLKFLKEVGAHIIGPSEQTRSCQKDRSVSVFNGKVKFSSKEWGSVTKGINNLGYIAREEGFKLCYHHHMGTGIQTIEETECFLNDTHPDYVFLLYDSGHFMISDGDPVLACKRFAPRIGHVHLKDVRMDVYTLVRKKNLSFLDSVEEGVFTVPGDGCIDFPEIFSILEGSGYEGWMVVEAEQDPVKANPFVYAKMAKEYLTETLGI